MANRLQFKFFRSYYDVAMELPDKDRLAFYDALIKKQFTGKESELKGMAKLAYVSQRFNIESQIAGWESKTQSAINEPINNPMLGGSVGGMQGGSVQVEVEVEEKVEEKEEVKVKVKEKTPKKILFRESEIFNIEVFAEKLRSACQGRFKNADMNYYYLNALTWSDSDNNKKVNWVATLVKWMNDDFSNNKLKTK